MKLAYSVEEKPPFKKNLVYAFQQLLAIIAATLLVPALVNLGTAGGTEVTMSQPAALFGAGAGTLLYVFCTKKRSPIFLGSSFAFISPLIGACSFGYFGIFLGAVFAGAVYVILAVIIAFLDTLAAIPKATIQISASSIINSSNITSSRSTILYFS